MLTSVYTRYLHAYAARPHDRSESNGAPRQSPETGPDPPTPSGSRDSRICTSNLPRFSPVKLGKLANSLDLPRFPRFSSVFLARTGACWNSPDLPGNIALFLASCGGLLLAGSRPADRGLHLRSGPNGWNLPNKLESAEQTGICPSISHWVTSRKTNLLARWGYF